MSPLAVYLTRPKLITDDLFISAAHGLADQVSDEQRKRGMLYPPQRGVHNVEVLTALKIARMIFDKKLAQVDEPDDLVSWAQSQLHKPVYKELQGVLHALRIV